LGSVGVIVAANFKILPRPQIDTTLLIRDLTQHQATEIVAKVLRSSLEPSAMTLIGGSGHPRLALGEASPGRMDLAVRCEGRREHVARHVRDIRGYAGEVGRDTNVDLDDQVARDLWENVTKMTHGIPQDPTGPHAALRVRGKRAELMEAIEELERQASDAQLACSWVAHAASGLIVAHLRPVREGDAWPAAVATTRQRLVTRARSAIFLRVRPVAPGGIDAWGDAPPGLAIMRRIKDAYDPYATLNAGRSVGGL